MSAPQSTYAKILAAHHVYHDDDRGDVVYIDRHFLHPETSPQAFDGLRLAKRAVRHPDKNFAPHPDNNISHPILAKQFDTLDGNAYDFHLARFDTDDFDNGLLHPGMTVAGHPDDIGGIGAYGALALPVTAATVQHVLATQTIVQKISAPLLRVELSADAAGRSIEKILSQITAAIGTAAAKEHVIEFYGAGLAAIDMATRWDLAHRAQKICHTALIVPDTVLFDYLRSKELAPSGRDWSFALECWEKMMPDENAAADRHIRLDAPDGAAVDTTDGAAVA
jgi:3-isopropylmalate/(R)-2-methylmalate dehydratase large subunit